MFVKVVKPLLRVVLVDLNAKVVQAWKAAFEDTPEVEIVRGSILKEDVAAWVTPTNARGSMDGGLDAVIKGRLGQKIETALQKEIARPGELLGSVALADPSNTKTVRVRDDVPAVTVP